MPRRRVEHHKSRAQANKERCVFVSDQSYAKAVALAKQQKRTIKSVVDELVVDGLKQRGR